jgi:hypothetical protein
LTTCNQWLAQGPYGPENNEDARSASIFGIVSRKCWALKILSEAQPAKQSFIPDQGISQLDLIPQTWRPETVNDEPYHDPSEFDKEPPLMLSLHKVVIQSYYVPAGQKHLPDATSHRLTLTEYARGDFNHDGTEDMLVLAFFNSDGTLRYGWLMAVTRRDDHSQYVDITDTIPTIAHKGPNPFKE